MGILDAGAERGRFSDRSEAGSELADALSDYADRDDVLVVALPRGGVPVGFEVAEALRAPLDVLTVRKLGHPRQPELAVGAIATGGVQVLNEEVLAGSRISQEEIDRIAGEEREELRRRERAYRGDEPLPEMRGKTVIVVDDGMATGSTMRAAVAVLRDREPGRIVVAVPVSPPAACRAVREEADEVVCLATPEPFQAISVWYDHFPQTPDDRVRELLERARTPA